MAHLLLAKGYDMLFIRGQDLTQDLNTPKFPGHLRHGIHPLQVLRDQNLRPLLSCACQEECCWSSHPYG